MRAPASGARRQCSRRAHSAFRALSTRIRTEKSFVYAALSAPFARLKTALRSSCIRAISASIAASSSEQSPFESAASMAASPERAASLCSAIVGAAAAGAAGFLATSRVPLGCDGWLRSR